MNTVNKTGIPNERLAVAQNPVFCQIGSGAFYHQDVIKLLPIEICPCPYPAMELQHRCHWSGHVRS